MLHYHGTPITPAAQLIELAGKNFCVSYARPDNVKVCHRIGQSVMLDNGAFSFWRKNTPTDWDGYMDWAERWLDYQTTWAVIPDVIDGTEEENDMLLVKWFTRRLARGAPVWHLHEPLDRLRRLAAGYERVCFGSSGEYAKLGTDRWHTRVSAAFDAIADPSGRVPWVHMLRGMNFSDGPYPFASVDSTDLAQNHNRGRPIREMADRWDAMQPPALWAGGVPLELVS